MHYHTRKYAHNDRVGLFQKRKSGDDTTNQLIVISSKHGKQLLPFENVIKYSKL